MECTHLSYTWIGVQSIFPEIFAELLEQGSKLLLDLDMRFAICIQEMCLVFPYLYRLVVHVNIEKYRG